MLVWRQPEAEEAGRGPAAREGGKGGSVKSYKNGRTVFNAEDIENFCAIMRDDQVGATEGGLALVGVVAR